MVIGDDHVTIASNPISCETLKPPQYLSQIWWVPSTCFINRPIKVPNYPVYPILLIRRYFFVGPFGPLIIIISHHMEETSHVHIIIIIYIRVKLPS